MAVDSQNAERHIRPFSVPRDKPIVRRAKKNLPD